MWCGVQTASSVRVGRVDSSRAMRELGVQYIPLEQSLMDTVQRMSELGILPP